MTNKYDLYAIGNALVDSEYEVSDAQLKTLAVEKRHMTLIDAERRAYLQAQVKDKHSRSTGGGSAGNTVVALAQLGGRAFYSCRVADDELGAFYRKDLASNGVDSNLANGPLSSEGQTGTCMVMVTPDAERSMSTFLGTTADLDHTALDPQAIANSKVYYMEGYLAASPTGLDAAIQGRVIAKQAGVKLATTLSDMSMINFCRPGLEAMIGNAQVGGLDYLFCNEEEAQVWCGSQDFAAVCEQVSQLATTVCLTRSAKGCVVIEGDKRTEVPAAQVKAVDTNGAGDMFAGAFLYAVTKGRSHADAAWLANQAAGAVVAQYGNRLTQQQLAAINARFIQHLG
ncbi:adenosine kinase [Rhodoferax saidenbachensis]|uniref:Adenosine kinase n=1 Tax=Rhodoferax saidenbachensis TaxID=1484693 RepID=A0A1P8KB89_9BURK|nr:adenosine kinase [Rhodoferax saidenbachensis]APW43272.1 adenosine kinase [Rhodoferax saidenbachensis]